MGKLPLISYKVSKSTFFGVLILFMLILGAIILKVKQEVFPYFINSPFQLLDARFSYFFDDFLGLSNWPSILFLYGLFFCCLFLTFVLAVFGIAGSCMCKDVRKFEFNWKKVIEKLKDSRVIWFKRLFIVLIIILFPLLQALEISYFYQGKYSSFFSSIHSIKTIVVLLGSLTFFYFVIRQLITDYGRILGQFLRRDLRYFTPSILSILVLFYVLRSFAQTDTLLLELVSDWRNFLLFTIFLFPLSLTIVWFGPYYLRFSNDVYDVLLRKLHSGVGDHQRSTPNEDALKGSINIIPGTPKKLDPNKESQKSTPNENESKDSKSIIPKPLKRLICYYLNLILPLAAIYKKDKVGKLMQYVTEGKLDVNETEGGGNVLFFHLVRRAFALIYILALIYLGGKAIDNIYASQLITPAVLLISIGLLFSFFVWYRRQFEYGKDQEIIKTKSILLFQVGSVIAVLFIIYLAISPFIFSQPTVALLVFVVVISTFGLITFLVLAFYRRFEKTYDLKEKKGVFYKILRNLDKWLTGFMMVFMVLGTVIAISFFISFWVGEFDLSNWPIKNINTLNVYLLLGNGLMGFIILFFRLLILRKYHIGRIRRNTSNIPARKILAFLIAGIVLIQFFSKEGNSYHEVLYQSPTSSPPSLEEFTTDFINTLDQDSLSEPIIFIASEGGGLRAAYWNLLVMNELDSMGLYGNVFLVSGASGGCIGQGIYLLMKSMGLDNTERKKRIEVIGSTNFLSGDLAGLMTRFPAKYFPEFPGLLHWSSLEDRMEAMTRHYFSIIQDDDPIDGFSYDNLKTKPYHSLWESSDQRLPILAVNTSRAEDGVRGVIMPIQSDEQLHSGLVDLSIKAMEDTSYISFPDALFLTNRFPLVSPAAKIEGKGHFVDGGYLENSGLGTVLQVITYMKTQNETTGDSIFADFFDREIIVLNLQNSRDAYIHQQFGQYREKINRINSKGEISAIAGTVAQAGMTGKPKSLDQLFNHLIDEHLKLKYVSLNLPYRINHEQEIANFHGGQIFNMVALDSAINVLNGTIVHTFGCDTSRQFCPIVRPPLGRVLSGPTRKYMRKMLGHEGVVGVLRDSL